MMDLREMQLKPLVLSSDSTAQSLRCSRMVRTDAMRISAPPLTPHPRLSGALQLRSGLNPLAASCSGDGLVVVNVTPIDSPRCRNSAATPMPARV